MTEWITKDSFAVGPNFPSASLISSYLKYAARYRMRVRIFKYRGYWHIALKATTQ